MRLLFLSMMVILSFSSSSFAYLCDINDAACMQRERALELMEQNNNGRGGLKSWSILEEDVTPVKRRSYQITNQAQANYQANKQAEDELLDLTLKELERKRNEYTDLLCFNIWDKFINDKEFMGAPYTEKEKRVNKYLNITVPNWVKKQQIFQEDPSLYGLLDKKLRAMFKERLPQLK